MIKQICRFIGIGIINTLTDFIIYTVLTLIGVHYLIAGFFGFMVSVIISYFLSFKFVFKQREDFSKKKSFIIFVILSSVGLLLNELCLWVAIDCIYTNSSDLQNLMSEKVATILAKCGSTIFVMGYNFLTRKLILEEKKKV